MSKSWKTRIPVTDETSKALISWVEVLLAIVLGLGMFPSFTALSENLAHKLPFLSRYMGPINFLKVFWPLMLVYIGLQWKQLLPWTRRWLPIIFLIGTLATLIAAVGCHFPPMFLREWFVICVGAICAVTLLLLPPSQKKITVILWTVIILSGACINLLSPETSNWLFANVFDFNYRVPESKGAPILLSGFYDIASMGKLLAWLPWAFGILYLGARPKKSQWIAFFLILVVCTVLIPVTTQRGPVLGMALGWILATAHLIFRTGQKRLLKWIPAALALVMVLSWIIIPTQILETRFLAYFGAGVSDQHAIHESRVSSDQRMRIWKLAAHRVATHPMGLPCPPRSDYDQAGIEQASHSHNLFLEQYSSRGWIWGSVHLTLWFLALFWAWKDPSWEGTLATGAVATTLGLGLVDHPWFVLNHAMIMWLFALIYWIKPGSGSKLSPL